MPYLRKDLQGFSTTIFAEMSALAVATGSINLGQGFPDTDGPSEVAEVAAAALRAGRADSAGSADSADSAGGTGSADSAASAVSTGSGPFDGSAVAGLNQYPPGAGLTELRDAVAAHQKRYYGVELDPSTEVVVTFGATEGVAASLLALCEPGDEVVVFEPFYDSYGACVSLAGARPRFVTLRPPEWTFDPDELTSAVTKRTKLLVLNSPHNPTGKVFTPSELDTIARCCVDHDLVAVTDEVYEHLVFDGAHIPIASLPGMRDRTVTISSAGKTFSFTGWKVGWACGPGHLVGAVRAAKQFLTYSGGGALQHAIAFALNEGDRFIAGAAQSLQERRDLFCDGLEEIGFRVNRPDATYFATTDISSLSASSPESFCRSLPERCGVVAVPTSAFYAEPANAGSLVRWAFCKRPEVLRDALTRLKALAV